MDTQAWTFLIVGLSFALYLAVAVWSKAGSTSEFYVAGAGVRPIANGAATAADWMSAASFISMAGIISFSGYDGSVYLMGWTGGYVLLALLLAPYLRKFGKYTVPDFVGDRYDSQVARLVAVVCAIFVSFTYVAGQMRGVGLVFARFLEVDITTGVLIGMGIVFVYAVLGGMKGITYTQVAQYCVLIFAFTLPAVFVSLMMTGALTPQVGMGSTLIGQDVYLLDRLDQLHRDLGFDAYTSGKKPMIDMLMITAALMVGTAGLPHVIVRFYTVPKVRDARKSAFWALLFIAILYTTAPAVGVFVRTNLLESIPNQAYASTPEWFGTWEDSGLVAWVDKNSDGIIQYAPGAPFESARGSSAPSFATDDAGREVRGTHGQRLVANAPTSNANELYIDRDIMVLANPEIAQLPAWVVGLVAAGGLAAALSTAAGLLLVISSSISHDLLKRALWPGISEKGELYVARGAVAAALVVAGYFGINPPGFVAQVVAFAFGLAASSFFPAIILGIFSRRTNVFGAVAGMVVGIGLTAGYIVYFKFMHPELNDADHWLLGVSPEGFGTIGMAANFAVSLGISRVTPRPPEKIQELISHIRTPEQAPPAHEIEIG